MTTSFLALTIAEIPFMTARDKIKLLSNGNLKSLKDINIKDAEFICAKSFSKKTWEVSTWEEKAKAYIEVMERNKIFAVSICDSSYPAVLRETSRPPYMLYVRGNLPNPEKPALAIVGTRYPSGRGLATALRIAKEAALSGIDVISGLARGIDSVAHKGAIEASSFSSSDKNIGKTFAILGCGIDIIYPASNKDVAAKMISQGGGIISEYKMGVRPTKWTFPERNRIIAGMSRSVLVIEAPGRSGSLITASFALEEGRDVFVAADCKHGPVSSGCDALEQDGAVAINSFSDIALDWNNISKKNCKDFSSCNIVQQENI